MHDSILAGNIWGSAGGAPSPRRGTGAAWGCTAQGSRTPAWRSDVLVILTEGGSIVELIKYTPYGEPISIPVGDTDSNFAWDDDDADRIAWYIESGGTYDVRLNPRLTGSVSYADITYASSITGGSQTLGRGVLSSEGVQNRFGYAGYRYDHHLSGGAGAGRHLYHVRHRVYQAHIGRWMTKDPLGYVDGMSLYEYVRSQPLTKRDPYGLESKDILDCYAECFDCIVDIITRGDLPPVVMMLCLPALADPTPATKLACLLAILANTAILAVATTNACAPCVDCLNDRSDGNDQMIEPGHYEPSECGWEGRLGRGLPPRRPFSNSILDDCGCEEQHRQNRSECRRCDPANPEGWPRYPKHEAESCYMVAFLIRHRCDHECRKLRHEEFPRWPEGPWESYPYPDYCPPSPWEFPRRTVPLP
jgi:RHS repeat-associated protein